MSIRNHSLRQRVYRASGKHRVSVTSRHLASSNQEGSLPCRHRSSVAEAALLASLTAAALVAGTATTAALGSSAQAAPTADCKAPYPVASLTPGQPVTGKTVSRASRPPVHR